jgi:TolB-like protein/class 3 adenylate cyclase/Tfp pilus assembly protein PilF
MADEHKAKRLEIAHVLFMDIVGYSTLLTDEQSEALQELNQIVRSTEAAREAEAAGGLTVLPTGDGMALVFTGSVEEPVECALEISQALRAQPSLPVRMGIHSGPIHHVKDANGRENIAGVGINIAQRVMDCGDAGHILVSKRVADDLAQQRRWQPYLHELGDVEVKHGVVVSLVNLYAETIGNPTPPARIGKARGGVRALSKGTRRGLSPAARAIFVIVGLFIALTFVLAIVSVIFAPAIMRSLDRGRLAALPQPTATAPPSLADTIKSAVAKKITEELQNDLSGKKKTTTESPPAASAIPEKSIAVLPFENLSEDKSNAYFAEGIQDEILTRLSKIADLKVISRTSTEKYKSAPDNLREIGQQLGVANLLEGSVQKSGNAVHINVQLIKAATDEHVWAESYDRELQNIFGVEGEVAGKIADALDAKLSGAEEKALAVKPTSNVAAYDAYLHGRSIEATRFDIPGEQQVASDYARAVQLDPTFALAWARLAIVRSFLYFNTIDRETNSPGAIKEAVDRAMALQPELGEAWLALGVYRYQVLNDLPGALQAYAEAGKRVPNSADVFGNMAFVERRMGRWDEAVSHFRKAISLDPRNLQLLIYTGETLGDLRNFAEAEDFVDRALQIAPDAVRALVAKIGLFQAVGRLDEASKVAARILTPNDGPLEIPTKATQFFYERRFDAAIAQLQAIKTPSKPGEPLDLWKKAYLPLLGYCQQLAGKTADACATYALAVQAIKPSPTASVPVDHTLLPCALALSYAGLGEKEKAVAEARKALTDYQGDALDKPLAETVLAQVEAQVGDIDAAVAALPHLLKVPAGLTPGLLRLDPYWDPLRKDPRFQKLCEEKPR